MEALSAVRAIGLHKGLVEARSHMYGASPLDEPEDVLEPLRLAGAYAPPAEDAFTRISNHRRARVVRGIVGLVDLEAELLHLDLQLVGDVLELAVPITLASYAVCSVPPEEKLDNRLPGFKDSLAPCSDSHTIPDRQCA